MMFDPPDYPFKELSETLRDQYGPDDFLFANEIESTESSSGIHTLAEVTEEMITNVENQLTLDLNEAGKYFNLNNASILNLNGTDQNTETLVVHTENLFNDSTLLDDSTVNQFLLPLQDSSENNKDTNSNGPDILALHSCVICHEIFTNDADLLDHTISLHASIDQDQNNNISNNEPTDKAVITQADNCSSGLDFDAEWLVCSLCERVLSTALEVQPSEQLCCNNASGKSCVSARRLHTMYVCDFCRGLFADADALDRHRLACFLPEQPFEDGVFQDPSISISNPPEEPDLCFKCDVCGNQYSSVEELKTHTAVCQRPFVRKRRPYNNTNTNKMWNCGSCNQLFTTARELYRHKRGEDRPPGAPMLAYACDHCDKVLGSMCALHTHKKMHKVTKPGYPCRVCSRRFNQSGHLAIHMRMHTGERPYPCDLCPKAFKVKVERDDHRRTHTGERPFACAACPKTFTAAARLREHARIHTDQRPYRCDICGAAFRRPYARTVHTLIHTGEKPHECDICGTAFRRSGDMWKHKRTLHGVSLNNDNETRS